MIELSANMRLIEKIDPFAFVKTRDEYVYCGEVDDLAGLTGEVSWGDKDSSGRATEEVVQAGVEAAELFLGAAGLNGLLAADGVIPKTHEFVSKRMAPPEAFFHADVAVDGFAGIILVGIDGKKDETTPTTDMLHNAIAMDVLRAKAAGGPLEGRLEDIFVVRPLWSPDNPRAWHDYYTNVVLARLTSSPLRELVNEDRLPYLEADNKKAIDETPLDEVQLDDKVFVTKLVTQSIVTGTPMMTCGVASREMRLAFNGVQSAEETEALEQLHRDIVLYQLGSSVTYLSEQVVAGSGLFVPVNQLHRAQWYNSDLHHRGVVGVKCYPKPGQPVPESWRSVEASEY